MLHGIINQLKGKLTSAKQAPAKLISPNVVVEKEELLMDIIDKPLSAKSQEALANMKKFIESLDSDPIGFINKQGTRIRDNFIYLYGKVERVHVGGAVGRSEGFDRSCPTKDHSETIALDNQFDISYQNAVSLYIDYTGDIILREGFKEEGKGSSREALDFLYYTLKYTHLRSPLGDRHPEFTMRILSLTPSELDNSLSEIEAGLLSSDLCINRFEKLQRDIDFLKKHNVDVIDFLKRLEKIYLPVISKQINILRKDSSTISSGILFPPDKNNTLDWVIQDSDRQKQIKNVEDILDAMESYGVDTSSLKNEFAFSYLDDIRIYVACIEDASHEWRFEGQKSAIICIVLEKIIAIKKMGQTCSDFENRLRPICIEMRDNELKKYESGLGDYLWGSQKGRKKDYDISFYSGYEISLMKELGWDIPDLICRSDRLLRLSYERSRI